MDMKILPLLFLILLVGLPCHGRVDLGEGIYLEKYSEDNSSVPKIAVLSVIINGKPVQLKRRKVSYSEIVSFGTRSKKAYCKIHGYDFIVAEEKISSCYGIPETRELEPAWTKLGLISRVLEDYDWVFVTDADSIILNFDVKLEELIDEHYDIIACTEEESYTEVSPYKGSNYINTGQVFYKNSEVAKSIITEAWKMHGTYTKNSWEQARINKVIRTQGYSDRVLVHPAKHFNIKPSLFEVGDFLVHMYSFHGVYLYMAMRKCENRYGHIVRNVEKSIQRK